MKALLLVALLAGPVSATDTPAMSVRLDCDVALMTPQRQLTNSTPVTISFVAAPGGLRDIHVVDTGGILYPGGNMRMVTKADAISMEAVPLPPERPGQWSGKIEKKMYRLMLKTDMSAEAAVIGVGRTPAAKTGRVGLVWNASNQPEGLPQPLSGSGVGNCAIIELKDSK